MRLFSGLVTGVLLVLPISSPGQVVGAASAAAGAAMPKAATMSDPYAAESLVVERMDTVYQYAKDGTGSKQITAVTRIQSEASARQYGVLTIPFAGSNEHVEIDYVRVRKPDGSVVETPPGDALQMPQEVTRLAPFYSDLKETQVPVRSLRVGDKLEYKVRVVQTRAEAPGQFWGSDGFGFNVVTLNVELELRVPKTMYVKVWSPEHAPVVTEIGDEKVYHWTGSQKNPTVGAAAEEAKKSNPPPAEGALDPVAWTTFRSWEEVGAWYRGVEGSRVVPDADVKAKVAEITAPKTPGVPLTDDEKRRAIYDYVSGQIRYIGVAFGIGRYQPHAAGEVLRNQYGDCKDKHTLLAAMMAAAGFKTEAVMIGAGVRMNEEVPSPGPFNHLITAMPIGDKTVWLDSTAEVAPYGMLLQQLRDKKALVVPDDSVAKLERTPGSLPFAASDTFEATGALDKDGTVTAHMVYTMRGDDEVAVRSVLRQVAPGQWDQLVQGFSQQLGFGGATSHVEAGRPDVTAEPLRLAYDYERKKLGDWDNYRIVPLFPVLFLPTVDDKSPPKQAIDLGEPRVEVAKTAIQLPEGWGAQLPDAVHEKTAYVSFDKTYRIDHGTLLVDRRVEVLQSKVPAAEWNIYKRWLDATVTDGESYIQLTSTGTRTGERAPPPGDGEDSAAANLLRAAYDAAMQRHDLKSAREELDLAKNVNPKQIGLWSMYGYLAWQQTHLEEAVEDYGKELELYPNEFDVYDSLAQAQILLGRRADAKATLRKRVDLSPEEMRPALMLAQLLLEDGEAPEAAIMLEAAAAKAPDDKLNPQVRVQMGIAEIKAGQKEKGAATLTSLLKDTTDAAILNEAAYQLADANVEMDLAEKSSRRALETLTAESAEWTLEGVGPTQLARSSLLVATWDTVGWVLFKEGKLDEAEGYIGASWRSTQRAQVGLHLGQIEEARGNKQAALVTYELARLSQPQLGPKGPARTPEPVQAELKRRADALWQKGMRLPFKDGTEELQKMRKLPVGNAGGRNGFANYDVLLSTGRVADVRPGSDTSTQLKDGEAIVRKLPFQGWTPPGSTAKELRKGALNCHSGVCEFVVFPM